MQLFHLKPCATRTAFNVCLQIQVHFVVAHLNEVVSFQVRVVGLSDEGEDHLLEHLLALVLDRSVLAQLQVKDKAA